ncbi:hypothetical protein G3O00_35130 [Burkholderia sp. Ac-20384]|uniref:hypothetical protein n=1 Tax=Burkholderia sp. Ac-20384 TaxID=2703902 RepID=UPI00197D75C7|nr:hypothetical protein [Burkholderia sp. Ac-20384]MBN3828800.1 hypothetical protein [Burkholderia sp. Ac-20384]
MRWYAIGCLIPALLFGMPAAALAEMTGDYFSIGNSPGQPKPSPRLAVAIDGNRATYYSHGRELELMPEAKYKGIGKYTGELNGRYRPEIDRIKQMLANHEIASVRGRNIGSVLRYSFERNGARYEGALQYRSSDEIAGKLVVFAEIAQDLLADGIPEINLHPAFDVHSAARNLVIDIVLGNDGAQDVVIDGPEKWSPKLGLWSDQYAQIHAWNDSGVEFRVALSEKYLSPASRMHASAISVKPGQKIRVEFSVPYDELAFAPGSSGQQIGSGSYRIAGSVKLNIQSPEVMSGKIVTPMDTLPAVELTER